MPNGSRAWRGHRQRLICDHFLIKENIVVISLVLGERKLPNLAVTT